MTDIFLDKTKFKEVKIPINYIGPSIAFKVPSKYKVVENLNFDLDLSESMTIFIAEKLIFHTENYFNKKINWKKVWFCADFDNPIRYFEDIVEGIKYTVIKGYLSIGASMVVESNIILEDKIENRFVYLNNQVSDYVLGFEWVPIFPFDEKNADRMFLTNRTTRVILNDIKSFKVTTNLSSMPHEGKFAIALKDIEDMDKVSDTLESARAKWNTQTDQARQSGDSTLEKGYCHAVSFDGVEDNIAYWYIDAGSAHDGIHEFLLKELSDSEIKIKSVEIQML